MDMSWLMKHLPKGMYMNRERWYESKGLVHQPRPQKRLCTKTPEQDLPSADQATHGQDLAAASGGSATFAAAGDHLHSTGNEKKAKVNVKLACRQSGVPGVRWCERDQQWSVSWREKGKRKSLYFPVKKFRQGVDFDQACEKARLEAVAVRKKKEDSGSIKVARCGTRNSGVRGITWVARKGRKPKWQVSARGTFKKEGKKRQKNLGYAEVIPDDVSEEAIEKALQIAIQKKAVMEKQYYSIKQSRSSSSTK